MIISGTKAQSCEANCERNSKIISWKLWMKPNPGTKGLSPDGKLEDI